MMSLKEMLCGFSLLHSIAGLLFWQYGLAHMNFLNKKDLVPYSLKKKILLSGVGKLLLFQHKGTSKSLAESC
jgi:hypothetical protein